MINAEVEVQRILADPAFHEKFLIAIAVIATNARTVFDRQPRAQSATSHLHSATGLV
jgi:hypothetical protein